MTTHQKEKDHIKSCISRKKTSAIAHQVDLYEIYDIPETLFNAPKITEEKLIREENDAIRNDKKSAKIQKCTIL